MMKEKLRTGLRRKYEGMEKSEKVHFFAQSMFLPSRNAGLKEGAIRAARNTERTVKTVKSVFAIFHLEAAAVQSVPAKRGRGDFTDFALILRMGMGGRGSMNPNLNLNLSGEGFFAAFAFVPIVPFGQASQPARRGRLVRRSRHGEGGCGDGGSNPVKVNQTSSVGQAGGQNRMQIHDNEQVAK